MAVLEYIFSCTQMEFQYWDVRKKNEDGIWGRGAVPVPRQIWRQRLFHRCWCSRLPIMEKRKPGLRSSNNEDGVQGRG